ncbi:Protein of unknown function [Gryllus bimaculatus]|nr:Protein of unknown function [Gryllus bimaculatus]
MGWDGMRWDGMRWDEANPCGTGGTLLRSAGGNDSCSILPSVALSSRRCLMGAKASKGEREEMTTPVCSQPSTLFQQIRLRFLAIQDFGFRSSSSFNITSQTHLQPAVPHRVKIKTALNEHINSINNPLVYAELISCMKNPRTTTSIAAEKGSPEQELFLSSLVGTRIESRARSKQRMELRRKGHLDSERPCLRPV